MLTIRKADDRGRANFGWLDGRHTFSFGRYYDPNHMGFGPLRVINDDRIAPGKGFPMHPHADMEIVTYVLDGALAHKDSLGNGSVIKPGDVQRMSAGTGIRHSEANPSATESAHLLQIWIEPVETGLPPGYEQKTFTADDKHGRLRLVASPDGRDGSVTVRQDVNLYASRLSGADKVSHDVGTGRAAWLQVATGSVAVNGTVLNAGDGASTTDAGVLSIEGVEDAEVLLFDMAKS